MTLIPTVRLTRLEENYQGSFGVLSICSKVFCVTLEPPDQFNKRDISNIPARQYQCIKSISTSFGETFEIINVLSALVSGGSLTYCWIDIPPATRQTRARTPAR